MALFSRRTIQRMLDENARWMLPRQVQRHVRTLNDSDSEHILPTEWEVAVLNGLSKLGEVVHEPKLRGSSKPDVLFRPRTNCPAVLADVTTVSDKGLQAHNPIDALLDDLDPWIHQLRTKGITGGFLIKVGEYSKPRDFPALKVRLKLPPRRRFPETIFNRNFHQFLAEIVSQPNAPHCYAVLREDTDLSIAYNPRQQFITSTYAVYTLAASKSENRVFASLADKAAKLKEAGFTGPLGIILCDGDCELLQRDSGRWSGAWYGVSDVVEWFLQQNKHISFIEVLTIKHDGNTLNIGPKHLTYRLQMYTNSALLSLDSEDLKPLMALPAAMPQPIKTAKNARCHLEWLQRTDKWDQGETHYGGMTPTMKEMKISLRTIHELLAGELEQKKFLEEYGHKGNTPFRQMLKQGRLIENVRVEKSETPESDDDWLIFEFGQPDPAVMPFVFRRPK
jgi:hypothetical protein